MHSSSSWLLPLLLVAGYEPRAVFPNHITQLRIAMCMKELMDEERLKRLSALQKEYKGRPCLGLQLNMWTDTNTHVSYAGLNVCTVIEPSAFKGSRTDGSKSKAVTHQLYVQSEVLDFNVFPFTEHTGENIRKWMVDTLKKHAILYSCVSGVTPDGAADGHCGLNLIPELLLKVDTCMLHSLQRAVLFSLGLTGASCKNIGARDLIKGHKRCATAMPAHPRHVAMHGTMLMSLFGCRFARANNQIRAVAYGIRKAQEAADIPTGRVLSTVNTMPTRWGNQYKQIERNNTLKPVLDDVLDKWKRENRGKKDAIVEDDDDDPGAKMGKPVPATSLGLSSDDWDISLELESFLEYPFAIKESIEHKGYLTGAQAHVLIYDLMQGCRGDVPLLLKLHPRSVRLADRKREEHSRVAADLSIILSEARRVMNDELKVCFFGERPSNLRMVQMFMSKQLAFEDWAPAEWFAHTKGLYAHMLREAAIIDNIGSTSGRAAATEPPRKAQKVGAGLFRFAGKQAVEDLPSDGPDESATTHDEVSEEMQGWKTLEQSKIQEFVDEDGVINEMAMMYKLRHLFPLHYRVFKQVSSHISHEANTEQLFSLAGGLSDDNGKMSPENLAVWTAIGANLKIYMPSDDAIKQRYKEKYCKKGTASDELLADEAAEA